MILPIYQVRLHSFYRSHSTLIFLATSHDGLQEQILWAWGLNEISEPSPAPSEHPLPMGEGVNNNPLLFGVLKKRLREKVARKNAFALSSFVSRKTNAIANAWDEGVEFTRL